MQLARNDNLLPLISKIESIINWLVKCYLKRKLHKISIQLPLAWEAFTRNLIQKTRISSSFSFNFTDVIPF
ncbi:MAG: hypothetical protein A2066_20045 [Bacteroidetes bacterium GWB2_41_8]|nr:MAG: hypothetical protein A2066_20045 [Bacteroidetes bacterium GWB2_41_8]